jgi:hypothetical protein
MKFDKTRVARILMSAREKLRRYSQRCWPTVRRTSGRLTRVSRQGFSTYTPSLRQVSGFVMIINTFLPVIVVVTLGLMIWSTASAIKRDACLTFDHMAQALADDKERSKYAKAADDDAREVMLNDLIKRLRDNGPSEDDPCQAWDKVKTNMKQTVTDIGDDIKAVGAGFGKMKTALGNVVPSIGLIKYSGIKLVDKAIWAANQIIEVIRNAFNTIGDGLKAIGSHLASPLVKVQKDLTVEFQKVDYKRAAAWTLLGSFFSDSARLFTKFMWFFIILAIWLVLSYVLWVYRRLAVGWGLLRNRQAIEP